MEDLTIGATESGPEIVLNTAGNISILGRSIVKDVSAYYKQTNITGPWNFGAGV